MVLRNAASVMFEKSFCRVSYLKKRGKIVMIGASLHKHYLVMSPWYLRRQLCKVAEDMISCGTTWRGRFLSPVMRVRWPDCALREFRSGNLMRSSKAANEQRERGTQSLGRGRSVTAAEDLSREECSEHTLGF